MNGIIFSSKNFPDLQKLYTYSPNFIIVDINDPKDMKVLEKYSRLQIPVYPLFTLGSITLPLFINMVNQCLEILNVGTIYIRATTQSVGSAALLFVEQFTEHISNYGIRIGILSPASNFLEHNSLAYVLSSVLHEHSIEQFNVVMFSNTIHSMSILNNRNFKISNETSVVILMLPNQQDDISPILDLGLDTIFFGLDSFIWYKENILKNETGISYVPNNVIALAHITKDRTSAWDSPTLAGNTTRKLFVGQPDLQIVKILPGNVGKTAENDYVSLANFKIERL